MKRILLALLFALIFTLPVFAQDDNTAVPTDTDVPALETEQVIATQEVVIIVTQTPAEDATATDTPEPEATAVVIDINVDVTDSTDGAGTTETPPPSDNTFERLALLALLLLLIVDKISGHFLSLKLANMVPMEWRQVAGGFVENAQRTGLQTAYDRVKATEDTWDDSVLFEGAKIIGWEFITNPDGSVTAQRIKSVTPPVVSPQG